MQKTLAEFEKGEDLVRVSLTEFHGRQYVDIRLFYMAEDGEWKPTKKGVTLSPELMRDVHEAIGKGLAELESVEG
ncbi:transcriptional coactivator p15/PC4 family protein [Candidatus Fermentibacterales bacterium]|nr:transcriptional coactivator p15/PC4 family protein [Candidatus Fermentibacterales bacterium]